MENSKIEWTDHTPSENSEGIMQQEKEYKVYNGRRWLGWGVSATMISQRNAMGLPHDVAKDIILHTPQGDRAIPYDVARVLMSHVHTAFTRIDNTYKSQHEYRDEKEKEWEET
jgi:hypothetical protein